jgi:hypothetical protein
VNNIADISKFETIQREAHHLMGFSSLSVFNATFKVVDKKKAKEYAYQIEQRKQDFDREEKFLTETKSDFQKKKAEFEKLKKAGQTNSQSYIKTGNVLGMLRTKRITSRNNLQHGIEELKKWGIDATSTELGDDD